MISFAKHWALPLALVSFLFFVNGSCDKPANAASSTSHPTPNNPVTTPPSPGDHQTNPTVTGGVSFAPQGSEYVTTIDWTHDAASGTLASNTYDIRVYEATSFDDKKPLPSTLTQLAAYLDNPGATDFPSEVDLHGKVPANGKYYYLVIDTLEYTVGSGKDTLVGRHLFAHTYTKGALGWSDEPATLNMSKSVIEIK
jgi:hypothetical protein